MSTERERALNRAKQKRFYRRHPDRVKKRQERYKRDRICNPPEHSYLNCSVNRQSYRTFELVDPRDPKEIPRIIGFCTTAMVPVWSRLWLMRNVSRSRWAAWLRDLDSLHLEPKETFGWTVGLAFPLSLKCVKMLVDIRVRQIGKATTGNEWVIPWWLLRAPRRFHYPKPAGVKGISGFSRLAVGRIHSDGRVERFASTHAAARALGMIQADVFHYAVAIATRNGWTWFDDGDGSASNSII